MLVRLDGMARISATLFSEMRNAVFANVAQGAVRRVARDTFNHLLQLDSRFHLSRQTGGLTRAIDRGTKYAEYAVMLILDSYLLSSLNVEGLHFCCPP